MAKRRLPLGIQTFRELRELDCYYVDKTAYVERLLDEGKYYFLSRPQRFGKSLFLDTLGELFEGSEELFAGLYIHERWTWSARHRWCGSASAAATSRRRAIWTPTWRRSCMTLKSKRA